MKLNLKLLFLSSGLLVILFGSSLKVATAEHIRNASIPSQENVQQTDIFLTATNKQFKRQNQNREFNAFFRSKYDYWDARVLADFWGQRVDEAKARMGRKILWGKENVSILEQYLVDARVQALQSAGKSTPSKPNPYKLYIESKYDYDDAVKLAKFWGDRTPFDAKLRIERNLILGQQDIVEKALRQAR
ncbi:MAG: hypothetical protein AAF208_01610 [Cyanobacteria bacterium P01_A01_bin.45]